MNGSEARQSSRLLSSHLLPPANSIICKLHNKMNAISVKFFIALVFISCHISAQKDGNGKLPNFIVMLMDDVSILRLNVIVYG